MKKLLPVCFLLFSWNSFSEEERNEGEPYDVVDSALKTAENNIFNIKKDWKMIKRNINTYVPYSYDPDGETYCIPAFIYRAMVKEMGGSYDSAWFTNTRGVNEAKAIAIKDGKLFYITMTYWRVPKEHYMGKPVKYVGSVPLSEEVSKLIVDRMKTFRGLNRNGLGFSKNRLQHVYPYIDTQSMGYPHRFTLYGEGSEVFGVSLNALDSMADSDSPVNDVMRLYNALEGYCERLRNKETRHDAEWMEYLKEEIRGMKW